MTSPDTPTPKRRGRKPGQGKGVKLGPRVGSRPWALLRLKPGEALLLPAPPGKVVNLMGQVQADATRNGLRITQAMFLAIQPSTREVLEIVRVTRLQ